MRFELPRWHFQKLASAPPVSAAVDTRTTEFLTIPWPRGCRLRCPSMPSEAWASRPLPTTVLPWGRLRCPSMPSDASGIAAASHYSSPIPWPRGFGCDAPRCRAMPRASRPLPSTVLPSHGLGAQKNSRNPWSRVGRLRCPSMPSDASGIDAASNDSSSSDPMPSRCRLDALRCLGHRGRFPLEFSSRCPPMPRASSCFPTEFSDPMPSRCPLDALRCRGHRAASQQSSQIRCPRGVAF